MQNQPLFSLFLAHLMALLRASTPRSPLGWSGLGMLVMGAIASTAQVVAAATLTNWNYDPSANQLELTVLEGTTPSVFVMAHPARIVVDLPNTEMGTVKLKETFSGAVRQVRLSQYQPGVTRVVLELASEVELSPDQVKLDVKGDRVVLRPLLMEAIAKQTLPPPPAIGADVSPVTTEPEIDRTQPISNPSLAQLPAEITTPLPPESVLPPAGLQLNPANAVTISVPPVALPVSPPTVKLETPPDKVLPTRPSTVQPTAPSQTPVVVTTSDMPSTVRSQPASSTTQVIVPTLTPIAPTATPMPPSEVTTPPIAVPALQPLALPNKPVVTPPASSVMQTTSTPTTSTPTTSTPTTGVRLFQPPPSGNPPVPIPQASPVVKTPPNSWVMQPAATPPGLVSSPSPASAPSLPAMPSKPPSAPAAIVPPNSWVMQSSTLPQPSIDLPLQLPVSSVIQQPPGFQSLPATQPTSVPPQPAVLPAMPATASPIVTIPPLPATAENAATPTVTVPALKPATSSGTPATTPVTNSPVIEFGEPLPMQGANSLNPMSKGLSGLSSSGIQLASAMQATSPTIALPIGTVFTLTYPGTQTIQLNEHTRQDMMRLQTDVRDEVGTVIFSQGSYVIGQFERTATGSKFTTSAIQRGDRIVPFVAESQPITTIQPGQPISVRLLKQIPY